MAALCQGLTLGGLLQGIQVVDGQYAGGWFDWLTPFTVLCGVAVVVGYALARRLLAGVAHRGRCRTVPGAGRGARLGDAGADRRRQPVDAVPEPDVLQRWFHWPGILLTSPVPLLVALLAVLFHAASRSGIT